MILYEFEAKKLLFEAGLNIPVHQIIDSPDADIVVKAPLVLKAQVLSGKRADVGGIVMMDDDKDLQTEISDLLSETINQEKVQKLLVEEKIPFEESLYISISYDTDSRGPILSFSQEGGTGIEERGVKMLRIDPLERKIEGDLQVIPDEVTEKLINLFFEQDMTLLEINPLVKTPEGRWVALDAKVKLDDDARFRHPEWDFSPRMVPGYNPSKREIEAKRIDIDDPRGGVAGSSYLDLPGDIAVMSSGGGISLTAMDALMNFGGRPANFTEYSGNPSREKVTKLTKIVLDKPDIHGLWVIGTVAANFTDIYETLAGLIEGLKQAEKELDTRFLFPIVIRRGGPREEEAFEMLKKTSDFDLHLQSAETSVTESAKIMADLAAEFKKKQEGEKV